MGECDLVFDATNVKLAIAKPFRGCEIIPFWGQKTPREKKEREKLMTANNSSDEAFGGKSVR